MMKQKQSKKCKKCGTRKKLEEFGKMPHSKDGTGHNPNCRVCFGASIKQARANGKGKSKKGKAFAESMVNSILTNLDTALTSRMMPAVNAMVNEMRKSGVPKVTIDLTKNELEMLTPERFKLGEES